MTRYDNPVFEVNGEGSVTKTLELLLELHHSKNTLFTSWRGLQKWQIVQVQNHKRT